MNGCLNSMIREDIIEMYASWSSVHYNFCMHTFVYVFHNGDVYNGDFLSIWLFE
jgi:hypothetical protein